MIVRKYTPSQAIAAVLLIAAVLILAPFAQAQIGESAASASAPTRFRVGEKLSYSITFGKFINAGYAETQAVSRGALSGRDSVELRSKVKTLDLVSAAFFMFDEDRTVFVAPDTGLPQYIAINRHEGLAPKETVYNYINQPTASYDLLSLIYRARDLAGVGTIPFQDNGKSYMATLTGIGAERLKVEAGEFDTTVSRMDSEYLSGKGIKDFRLYLSADEDRIPVFIRFKTPRGEFRLSLMAIAYPPPPAVPVSVPVAAATPGVAVPRVKPTPVPEIYVANRPLAPELGFNLGEVLDYKVVSGGRPLATVTLNARERSQILQKTGGEDSLLLTAIVTAVDPGVTEFRIGDAMSVRVDPDTLAPKTMESKFSSVLPGLNQNLIFDRRSGNVAFGGAAPIDAPVGTHTLLSLVYAMRSFNLQGSRDAGNPVNDTRVAVFWENRPYIFTLRPSAAESITVRGEKRMAQMITVNTSNPQLDALAPKVWLSLEDRVPLRFTFGPYTADLAGISSNLPK